VFSVSLLVSFTAEPFEASSDSVAFEAQSAALESVLFPAGHSSVEFLSDAGMLKPSSDISYESTVLFLDPLASDAAEEVVAFGLTFVDAGVSIVETAAEEFDEVIPVVAAAVELAVAYALDVAVSEEFVGAVAPDASVFGA